MGLYMKSFLLTIFLSFVLSGAAFSKGFDVDVEQKIVQIEEDSSSNKVESQSTVASKESNELVLYVLFILLPIFYCLIRTNGKHA